MRGELQQVVECMAEVEIVKQAVLPHLFLSACLPVCLSACLPACLSLCLCLFWRMYQARIQHFFVF